MTTPLDYAALRQEAITVAREILKDHRSSDMARVEAARLILDFCHGYDPPPPQIIDLRATGAEKSDERPN